MFLRYMQTVTLVGILIPSLFNTIVPTLMTIYHNWERNSYYSEVLHSRGVPENTFDFIIVGGGSAGSVLANRLSKYFTVLLLEREGEPNILTSVPLNAITLYRNPDVDYGFVTKPQTAACLGAIDNYCAWSRGKALGGSFNINYQIYLRGHPKDYNNWANITGDDRWSYSNVLPFFLKSEDYCVNCEHLTNLNSEPTFNPFFHNVNGYLTLEKSTSKPLLEELMQASDWDGVRRTDLNAPYSEAHTYPPYDYEPSMTRVLDYISTNIVPYIL